LPKYDYLEFKAVIVLHTITRNYGNCPYGNYVGNAPVDKVINYLKQIKTENALLAALSLYS